MIASFRAVNQAFAFGTAHSPLGRRGHGSVGCVSVKEVYAIQPPTPKPPFCLSEDRQGEIKIPRSRHSVDGTREANETEHAYIESWHASVHNHFEQAQQTGLSVTKHLLRWSDGGWDEK